MERRYLTDEERRKMAAEAAENAKKNKLAGLPVPAGETKTVKRVKPDQVTRHPPSRLYLIEKEKKRIWGTLHNLDGTQGTGSPTVDEEVQRIHGKFHGDPYLGNFRAASGDVPVADQEEAVPIPLFDAGYGLDRDNHRDE